MAKRIPLSLCLLLIGVFHSLSIFLLAGALYFILYPSFFGFAYPNNTSLNLFWLLFITPLIFEFFFMQQNFRSNSEVWFNLFTQRLGFEILIKGSYLISILFLAPDVSLTQIRIFFVLLLSLVFNSLKFYLIISYFGKRRKS